MVVTRALPGNGEVNQNTGEIFPVPGNPNPTPAPPYRGRLLNVEQVHDLLDGAFSVDWIYKNLQAGRRKLSTRCVRWREWDVIEWIERDCANETQ